MQHLKCSPLRLGGSAAHSVYTTSSECVRTKATRGADVVPLLQCFVANELHCVGASYVSSLETVNIISLTL